jgi:hypothetical protein
MICSTPSRVCGYRVDRSELDCFTFSPSANFTPGGASANFICSGPAPHRSLTTWFCPPIGLADPCRMFDVVTPPASWR